MNNKLRKIELTECGDNWAVAMSDRDAIYPTTSHKSKRLAVSRILQLLDIGPVAPQIHTEEICIGEIVNEQPY